MPPAPRRAAGERRRSTAAGERGSIITGMELDPAWYDAIAVRRSRRRYGERKIAKATLAALQTFCDENS